MEFAEWKRKHEGSADEEIERVCALRKEEEKRDRHLAVHKRGWENLATTLG